MEVRKPVRKRATELNQGSKTRTQISKSETRSRVQSRLDELHKGIQSKLDELHADLRQLKTDLQAANQANSRARKDPVEGFKQALRDILEAATDLTGSGIKTEASRSECLHCRGGIVGRHDRGTATYFPVQKACSTKPPQAR